MSGGHNQRSLTAASALQSVVSGTGIANFTPGSTLEVIVTAKDSNGNDITTGGELFLVIVSNIWTKYNQYYCQPSWGTGPLSTNIEGIMTDYNNGTYSYSYTVSNSGKVFFWNLNKI